MSDAALLIAVISKLVCELIVYGGLPLAAVILAFGPAAAIRAMARDRRRAIGQVAPRKEVLVDSGQSHLGTGELESLLKEIGLGLLLIDLGRPTEAREVIRALQRDLSKRLNASLAAPKPMPYDWAEDDLGSSEYAEGLA